MFSQSMLAPWPFPREGASPVVCRREATAGVGCTHNACWASVTEHSASRRAVWGDQGAGAAEQEGWASQAPCNPRKAGSK